MITSVGGENFKGLTFETPLDRHTLLLGENGSGKSARTQALQLCVNGYIPGEKNIKKNDEILTQYSPNDEMKVWCSIDGTKFSRRFVRSEKGSVRQDYLVNDKKVKADEFMIAMGKAGFPIIIDLNELFIDISDAKKIDTIFQLYPPEGDLSSLDTDITKVNDKINALEQKMTDNNNAAKRLTVSRTEITLPSGSLADTKAEIEKAQKDLESAREDLKAAEIKEAEAAAAAAAKKEAEEKAKAEAEALVQKQLKEKEEREAQAAKAEPDDVPEFEVPPLKTEPIGPPQQPSVVQAAINMNRLPPGYDTSAPPWEVLSAPRYVESLQTILDTINKSGCSVCAARLIALREMKKYREVT